MMHLQSNLSRSGYLLVVLSVAACGSDGPPLERLWEEAVSAHCERLVRCGMYEDAQTCAAMANATPLMYVPLLVDSVATVQAGVANGTIVYDRGAAADCLAYIASAACNVWLLGESPAACERVLLGTVGDEQPCFVHQQCESRVCVISSPCDVWSCCELAACALTLPEAQVGEQCFTADCVPEAYCAADGVCTARESQGQECAGTSECEPGLYCAAVPADGTTRCQKSQIAGEPCFDGDWCLTPGLSCDLDTVTCVPARHEGEPCESDNDLCQHDYLRCDVDTGRCERLPEAGEPCTELSSCAPGLYCSSLSCFALKPNGEHCQVVDNTQCWSGYCDETTELCADAPSCIVE